MILRPLLKIEKSMEDMRELTLYGQGKKPLPEFKDQFSTLEFPALKGAYRTADAAAAKAPSDMKLRLDMIYKFALARDSKISFGGRKYCRGLGLHNDFRSAYDAARAVADSQEEA